MYARNEDFSPAIKRSRMDSYVESPIIIAANKKLSFDLDQTASPMFAEPNQANQESTPSMVIDEDSCDSGFSESVDLVTAARNESFDIFQTEMIQFSPFDRSHSVADLAASRSRKFACRTKSVSAIDNFNDAAIMEALEKLDDEQAKSHQLAGDMRTQHALPVLQTSKHKDLASISPNTVSFPPFCLVSWP